MENNKQVIDEAPTTTPAEMLKVTETVEVIKPTEVNEVAPEASKEVKQEDVPKDTKLTVEGEEEKAADIVEEKKATDTVEKKKSSLSPKGRKLFSEPEEGPASKAQKLDVEDYMPLEALQTLQQLASPKLGNNGLPCRPQAMTIVDGRPMLPDMSPLEQCQHLQQIQGLIHYHEQQVKYRSYIQLEILRNLRKQLNDQMLLHPHRHNYDALVEAAKNNRLTPLSVAERAQLEFFSQMADWTLDARASLQNKESAGYLQLLGRQVTDFKSRMNEITTHEQFQAFGPMFAERIDYHRELIHTLNRRSSVSLG